MSRVKISEYRAKVILGDYFGSPYDGKCIDLSKDLGPQINEISFDTFVVKVDQAIKKRNKLGLVFVKRTKAQALKDLEALRSKGYDWALVEPFVAHGQDEERFIALSRTKPGIELQYSTSGGNDIEENQKSLEAAVFDQFKFDPSNNNTKLDSAVLAKLYNVFQACHMTYMEMNPALIHDGKLQALDAAVEVDSSARFFVKEAWGKSDLRDAARLSAAEKTVEELADQSPASFSLKVLNKDGAVFLLLSGGGASIVVADEFAAQGLYDKIANYGEYSGNPNEDETYIYTKALLGLVLDSKALKKVLVIGGGTANFTDIAKTFKGVLRAMDEVRSKLEQQKVAVYVRRGGPNQEQGLAAMRKFLDSTKLKHEVCGPDVAIAALVQDAVEEFKNV